jgi:hypothetical protein
MSGAATISNGGWTVRDGGGPTLETVDKQDKIGELISLLTKMLVGCKIVSEVVSGKVGSPRRQLVVVEERRPRGLLRLILLLPPCMVRTVELST